MMHNSAFKSINCKLLVLFLCISLLDWAGYGYYVFYLAFGYLLMTRNLKNLIDKDFFYFFFMGFFYVFINFANTGDTGYVRLILPMVNYPVAYLAGRYLAKRNNESQIISILWLFALSLALISMISIQISINENGFNYAHRNVHILSHGSEGDTSTATGIYSCIMLLTTFVSFFLVKCNKLSKVLYVASAVVAIYFSLRLASRTSLFILAIAMLILILINSKRFLQNQKWQFLLTIGTMAFAIIYIITNYSDDLLVLDRLQDTRENGVENMGGRRELSLAILHDLSLHPFGGLGSERYAHNLWLDCARISGWLPLVFLLIITVHWAKYTLCIIKNNYFGYNLRHIVLVFSVSLFVYFNTEPILEGCSMLFMLFCIYYGILRECKAIVFTTYQNNLSQ